MDNLLEILVPIIFAAIYFFGHMFSGKSDEDAPNEPPARHGGEDADAAERKRRIQEEIRRKIMERQGQTQEGGQGNRSPSSQPSESAYDRRLERRGQANQSTPETLERPVPATLRRASDSCEGDFSWDQSDDIYSVQMEGQLKQIEATKRQAAKLTKQAQASRERLKFSTDSKNESARQRSALGRRSVRSTLTSPNTARTAFIYGEVLGTPVSQKKTATVPGLQIN